MPLTYTFLNLDNNWSNLAPYYNNVAMGGNFNTGPRQLGDRVQPGDTRLDNYINVVRSQAPRLPRVRFLNLEDNGLIRGGLTNAAIASALDFNRITGFLTQIQYQRFENDQGNLISLGGVDRTQMANFLPFPNSAKGALFIIKQVGLQKSNPTLEQEWVLPLKKKFVDNPTEFAPRALFQSVPTRTYNLGANTLLQTAYNAFGGHIIRHGKSVIGGGGFFEGDSITGVNGYNYEKIVTDNNKLQEKTIESIPEYNSNRLVSYLSKIADKEAVGSIILSNDQGGANTVYGFGNTIIKTTKTRTTINKSDDRSKITFYGLSPELYVKLNGFTPLSTKDVVNSTPSKYGTFSTTLTSSLADSPLPYNKGIARLNIESRIGTSTKGTVDAINAISITDSSTFYKYVKSSTTPNTDPDLIVSFKDGALMGSTKKVDGYFGRDIVRLNFEFLNNDTPINGGEVNTDVLIFRAYIDDFNDGMNAKWNSYRYMGRGEEFYVYEGFTRDISLAFTIFAHTEEEMKPLYQKLNYLMSTFTPDYSVTNKMRGNIGYLTVGDYISRQPGIFTDIKLSNFLDSSWENNLNYGFGGGDNKLKHNVVPKMIKVSLSFKPIHSTLPRKVTRDDPFKSNFILPLKSGGKVENHYL